MQGSVWLTSGFGDDSWNWIKPILAFSILVGPPALFMTGWFSASPSISSVSSIVPPTFLTSLISRKSTLEEVGVTRRVTAETAMGARVDEYCETIYHVSSCLDREARRNQADFGVQTRASRSEESITVVQVDWRRHAFQELDGFCGGVLERLRDGRGVNT